MSAFAASTEKIVDAGLSASSSSLGIQTPHDPSGHESRRLKIAAAIVFVLIAMVAGAALIGIYLSQPHPPPEVFTIVLKDPEAAKPARIKLKFNKMERIEYSMSPTVENSHDMIYMLKDYSRGLVAHKDFRQGLCLIGRLNDTEESAKQRAKAFKNKLMQVAATDHFLILNGSVHPEVLAFAAGWRLAHYCGSLAAHWLVKRMISDPLPPEHTVVEIHGSETENSKVNPGDEEQADLAGEEEKMQILTDTNPNDEAQNEPELPPEDPALLQEAEKTALLEEKTSILAEKLDLPPEETLRPASLDSTRLDELSSSPNAPPTDTLPRDPFLEEKNLFVHRTTAESDPVTNAEEEAAAAEFGRSSDEKNEEVPLPVEEVAVEDKTEKEEKTEEIKSTADEKSTVEKAPHVDEREKEAEVAKAARLLRDPLMVDEPLVRIKDAINKARARLAKRDTHRRRMAFHEQPHTLDSLSRHKRNSCTIRCWYFIRKLKGYRRCVYRCF